MNSALGQLRLGLQELAIQAGHDADPHSAPPELHRLFRAEELPRELPRELRDWLLESPRKVADLFEHCVAAWVVEQCNRNAELRRKVAAVYSNVVAGLGADILCELDTLLLLHTGDLVVLEVKTHPNNCERKKIEANIKQLRDFGGGVYSRYCLVFPLLSAEIDQLTRTETADLEPFVQLGMSDAHVWGDFCTRIDRSRDQKLVGIDRLGSFLMQAAGVQR